MSTILFTDRLASLRYDRLIGTTHKRLGIFNNNSNITRRTIVRDRETGASCTNWHLLQHKRKNQIKFYPEYLLKDRSKATMSSYTQHMFQSDSEKENFLKSIGKSNWTKTTDREAITKTFTFRTFVQAFSFMTAVAMESEKIDHHPEWSNVYNRVEVTLTSHFCNGISLLDMKLAKTIDQIYVNSAKD